MQGRVELLPLHSAAGNMLSVPECEHFLMSAKEKSPLSYPLIFCMGIRCGTDQPLNKPSGTKG